MEFEVLPLTIPSAEQAEAFGQQLGKLLQGGDCIALIGPLGSGKTTLCRGLGRGLETQQPLRSPSYLLCHEVEGRHPVLHLDAYFAARMESLLMEGLAQRFDSKHVLLVEWADQLVDWWPTDRLEIRIQVLPAGRRFLLQALGPVAQQRLLQLKNCGNLEVFS